MVEEAKKKILVVDDSALMRRVICDIINSDKRFQVVAKAVDGVEAFDLMSRESYDAVVLDINMPRMSGLEVLKELRKFRIHARVLVASTDTKEGARVTMDALELGALDFIQKPVNSFECRNEIFMHDFLDTLYAVCNARLPLEKEKDRNVPRTISTVVKPPVKEPAAAERKALVKPAMPTIPRTGETMQPVKPISIPATTQKLHKAAIGNRKIVAIASSTGGPRALQSVIPKLPQNLDAPVLLVQHMPKGFTASLAERLNEISAISVKEAKEGELLEKGCVYVAMGGQHFNVRLTPSGVHVIHYSDEPTREGVKPCANYMYESLSESKYSDVLCVVMTGMGADGTEGIQNLKKENENPSNMFKGKNIAVISQNQNSCVVYGMPKSVVMAGLSDDELDLDELAGRITEWVGQP